MGTADSLRQIKDKIEVCFPNGIPVYTAWPAKGEKMFSLSNIKPSLPHRDNEVALLDTTSKHAFPTQYLCWYIGLNCGEMHTFLFRLRFYFLGYILVYQSVDMQLNGY